MKRDILNKASVLTTSVVSSTFNLKARMKKCGGCGVRFILQWQVVYI